MFYDGLTNVLMKQSQEASGTKPCDIGDEAMLCWGRSCVFEGSKLCYLCCNAIAKDPSLSRE